jgi:hypothetical protein
MRDGSRVYRLNVPVKVDACASKLAPRYGAVIGAVLTSAVMRAK